MEDIAIVRKVEDNLVYVEIERSGSCEGCAVHGICNLNDKTIIHKIKTDRDLKVGDRIEIHIKPSLKIFSSFVVFIVPVLFMLCFYVMGKFLFKLSEDLSIVVSMLGLLLSGLIIYLIDKLYANKLNFKIIKKI
ncbi:MAG: SoxR reducing system RseC family protein [Candidatus Tenebribacter davisii]|jgi:positive regulator of sigma E activity|nr:SoxR reducing system RseC family protein [Candidatus Tenebribacter davisii]